MLRLTSYIPHHWCYSSATVVRRGAQLYLAEAVENSLADDTLIDFVNCNVLETAQYVY